MYNGVRIGGIHPWSYSDDTLTQLSRPDVYRACNSISVPGVYPGRTPGCDLDYRTAGRDALTSLWVPLESQLGRHSASAEYVNWRSRSYNTNRHSMYFRPRDFKLGPAMETNVAELKRPGLSASCPT